MPTRSRNSATSPASRSTRKSSCGGGRFRENILFTHRGLSGPAILQISSYWNGRDPLTIDLLPDVDAAQWLVSDGTFGGAAAERAGGAAAARDSRSSGARRGAR